MEFNFDCEHIKGVDNSVADYFSRLKPRTTDEVVMMCYSPTEPTIDQQQFIEMCHAMVWAPALELGTLATSSNREYLARMALLEPIPMVIPDQVNTEAEAHKQPTINLNDHDPMNSISKRKKRKKSVTIQEPITTLSSTTTTDNTNPLMETTTDAPINTTSDIPTTANSPYLHETVLAGDAAVRDIRQMYDDFKTVHGALPGHHGVERTIHKLQLMGHHWPTIRQDVRDFVRACPSCQKMAKLKRVITAPRYTLTDSEPWRTISVDIMGLYQILF
jgi:hypothetical protein